MLKESNDPFKNISKKDLTSICRVGYGIIIVLILFTWDTHAGNNKLCAEHIYFEGKCSYNEVKKLCTCGDKIFNPKESLRAEVIEYNANKSTNFVVPRIDLGKFVYKE